MRVAWSVSHLRRQLTDGRAARDLLALVSGTMGARVLQVLAVPFIARLFDPADYGRVSVLVALATTMTQASSLGYEGAIALPKHGRGARQISRLALLLLGAFTVTVALIASQWPAHWQPPWLSAYPAWWLILALIIALLGCNNVLHAWALRRKRFGTMASSTLAQAGVTTSGRVAWGVTLGPTMTGLLTPYVGGLLLRALILLRQRPVDRQDEPQGSANTHDVDEPADLAQTAQRYAHFALFGLPSTLVRSLTQRLPLLLVGALFAPAVAGFYAAANRLMLTPAQAIGQAGRQVALPRAAGRRRRGEPLFAALARATLAFAALALVPFLLLWQLGEPLLIFVLGEAWSDAGRYAQPLAPWGYSMLIVGPASAVFQALEKQRAMLALSTVRLGFFIASAGMAANAGTVDPVILITYLAWAGVLANALQLGLALYVARAFDRSLTRAQHG